VARVYCGGAHLSEDCSANSTSVNCVGNFIKNNNPDFSWSNNQYQEKSSAHGVPPGFATHSFKQLEAILKALMQDPEFHY
jgi:hypothetical protein